MMHILKKLSLKREAVLLDSWLFIIKAMVALSVGYIAGNTFSVTRLDMISVLLGVMYNLEPTNVSGLRSGYNQLLASTLGALTTGILVYLMGYQISFVTIALGMAFTIFFALKIDYRMVSPVAIFTSIYMTQFIQSTPDGIPSIFLTFRLRIAALGLGVLVAILSNFLFSFLYYKKIGRKRCEFIKLKVISALEMCVSQINDSSIKFHTGPSSAYASVFSDIEMVKSNIQSMLQERFIPFHRKEYGNLELMHQIVQNFKNILHFAYDSHYLTSEFSLSSQQKDLAMIYAVINQLQSIDFTTMSIHQLHELEYLSSDNYHFSDFNTNNQRITSNLFLLTKEFNKLVTLTKKLQ